jgi:uncharacterized repeat protein (TIGR03803 family)
LALSGNTLFWTELNSGTNSNGAVFSLNTDGTGFRTLYNFTAFNWSSGDYMNSDGGWPRAGLILSGNILYGTTSLGGSSASGTIFKLNTDGTGFTNLYSFTGTSDGAEPMSTLVLSGNTLFGTTSAGGVFGQGTVFAVSADGTGFVTLHNFDGTSDGGSPEVGKLSLSGDTLYGTAADGGSDGGGTVFKVNTNGTGFTVLHSFTGKPDPAVRGGVATNADGAWPTEVVLSSSNILYGTTWNGGSWASGTIFKLNTDGTGFTNLHDFNCICDGGPYGGLIFSGNTLYGSADSVFKLNTDGSGFATLQYVPLGSGVSGLISSGNTLYGIVPRDPFVASAGMVFSLSFPPELTIRPNGPSVVMTWPTNYAGFDYSGFTLHSTTNLLSPVWTTNVSAPVVVNGQYTVTNPIYGTQQFFRLSE